MKMDLSKLPLHKKTTIIAEKFILAIARRISNDEAVVSYVDLTNRQEVLRILQKLKYNRQILQYADAGYWDIFADGKKIINYDFSQFKDFEAKIKANTSNRLLEIISFNRALPQKIINPMESILRGSY